MGLLSLLAADETSNSGQWGVVLLAVIVFAFAGKVLDLVGRLILAGLVFLIATAVYQQFVR